MRERVSSSDWVPPWLHHEHVSRYRWACDYSRGCRVIDAACGNGYGSAILAEEGAPLCVMGFDSSPEPVAAAQRQFAKEGVVSFQVADVKRLPVPDHACDLYLCFETIEHVEEDRAVLEEAVRVVRPGARFVCSTPNRDVVHPGTSIRDRPVNPYHVREYRQDELGSLLGEFFGTVQWYGQTYCSLRYCRCLAAIGRRLPGLAFRLHQVQKVAGLAWRRPAAHFPQAWQAGRQPEVLIAVCTA